MFINWIEILNQWKISQHRYEPHEHYHTEIIGSDNLVLCLGDSWTNGRGLEKSQRLAQMFGKILATHYNADWINIGCDGWSNSWILHNGEFIIPEIIKRTNYKKILVVITLTENGRDVGTPVSFNFNYVKCAQEHGCDEKLYDIVLEKIEDCWLEKISNMIDNSDKRFKFFIGKNFAWHPRLIENIKKLNCMTSDINWIELLADIQNLPRPIRSNLVTGWIFDSMKQINDIAQISDDSHFKSWAIPYIDKANEINNWLNMSPMNYKKDSKHPTAPGHHAWANHIIDIVGKL